MPDPKPLPLGYEPPQGRAGSGAYIAAGAAVALAMLIALVSFRAIGRIGGFIDFPLWFRVVASGLLGVVATAAVAGWISLLVALGAAARRAGISRRRSANGDTPETAGDAELTSAEA